VDVSNRSDEARNLLCKGEAADVKIYSDGWFITSYTPIEMYSDILKF